MNRRAFLERLGLGSAAVAASVLLPPLKPEELKRPLEAKAEMFSLSNVQVSGGYAVFAQINGDASVGDYLSLCPDGRVRKTLGHEHIVGIAFDVPRDGYVTMGRL